MESTKGVSYRCFSFIIARHLPTRCHMSITAPMGRGRSYSDAIQADVESGTNHLDQTMFHLQTLRLIQYDDDAHRR